MPYQQKKKKKNDVSHANFVPQFYSTKVQVQLHL